jgi:hypothetical protein
MMPLGQLILRLTCLGPAFDLAGAILTSPLDPFPRFRIPTVSPLFNFPFSHFTRGSDGHCTRKHKNWSNGQSNFASHYAMLRVEIFQMRSALTSVGESPPRQKYGGQGGAGLQSSGSAVCAPRSTLRGSGTRAISGFEHLLPFALIHPRKSGFAFAVPASSFKLPVSRIYSQQGANRNRPNS